jgi:23S rRNA (cytosine1962-C5)-methyltransferase
MTATSDALANRLRKNARHLARWAKREGLEAYRLYDRDIPDFPYVVDRYGDRLHVQLIADRRQLHAAAIDTHLAHMATALAVAPAAIAFKVRQRQRGSSQYAKLADDGEHFVVRERELKFEVCLTRYLDSGLFLDHRETRRLVGEAARDRTVLNLFAYTGSFTVYAAAGGARSTTTVDLSHTYQAWSARNLARNGFAVGSTHELVAADSFGFLERARRARRRWDLIVLDPPSFSNSKRMRSSFDVQRDHLALLDATLAVMARDGTLYFSTNRHGFKFDSAALAGAACEEISRVTRPADFARRAPHRCWRLRHA